MAPTADVNARIERDLRVLSAELEDLPQVVADWDAMPDGERAAFSLDWDHMMASYLGELRDLDRRGVLDKKQQRRLQRVLQHLHEIVPLGQRIGLYVPSIE